MTLSSSWSLVGCNLALCLKYCKEPRHTWEKGKEEILPWSTKASIGSADFIFFFAHTAKLGLGLLTVTCLNCTVL